MVLKVLCMLSRAASVDFTVFFGGLKRFLGFLDGARLLPA